MREDRMASDRQRSKPTSIRANQNRLWRESGQTEKHFMRMQKDGMQTSPNLENKGQNSATSSRDQDKKERRTKRPSERMD